MVGRSPGLPGFEGRDGCDGFPGDGFDGCGLGAGRVCGWPVEGWPLFCGSGRAWTPAEKTMMAMAAGRAAENLETELR
jgi:hypothetical protein